MLVVGVLLGNSTDTAYAIIITQTHFLPIIGSLPRSMVLNPLILPLTFVMTRLEFPGQGNRDC